MRKWFAVALASLVAAPAQAASEHVVTMDGSDYAPAQLSARVGDSIRFVNDDAIDHNVFVPTAGHAVDFGRQEPGQEVTMELAKAGSFDVECVFHEHMLTTVEVEP